MIPSIRDGIAKGTPIAGLALVEAVWARMCEGTREDGSNIKPNDPFWNNLQICANLSKENPTVWLEMRQIYGDLAHNSTFVDMFANWLSMIWDDGLEATLKVYLSA